MLDPKFEVNEFKRTTDIKGKRRGKNMHLVDEALEAYWKEARHGKTPQDQMSAAYYLLKACNTWLKYKKDKLLKGNTKDHFKTRWDEVKALAEAALDEYQKFAKVYVGPLRPEAVRFETKKLDAMSGPKPSLKALDAPYAHEFTQWDKSKKTRYPISGTTVHETMDTITNPQAMAYDAKKTAQFGGEKVFGKQFDQLTLVDWVSIDKVMDAIEQQDKTKLTRHVRFLKKADRIQHLVVIRNGKLTKEDGSFWDTGGYQELYVMDEYGNLFIGEGSLGTRALRLNHSSMLAGKAVLCAGTVGVRQGVLIEFNNNSGHYKPTGQHVFQALEALDEDGADLSQTQVTIASSANHGWAQLTVAEVIRNQGVFAPTHPKAY